VEAPRGFSRTTLCEDYKGKYSQGFLAAIDAALEPRPAERSQSVGEWRERFESSPPEPPKSDAPTLLQPAVGTMDATLLVAPYPVTIPEPTPAQPPPAERPEAVSKARS
jgi:hypothetical protein